MGSTSLVRGLSSSRKRKMKEEKEERVELKDFARGLYVWEVNKRGRVKVYDGWEHVGWEDVLIKKVMVRATNKSAYYIIKFRYLKDGVEDRIDCINDFRINDMALKRYLEKI